jgi:hypothetical protein
MNQSKTFQTIIITILVIIALLLAGLLFKQKQVAAPINLPSQNSTSSDDQPSYDGSLVGLSDEQVTDLMKGWKKVMLPNGQYVSYPPDWTFVSPMGQAKLYPPWNSGMEDNDYIALGMVEPNTNMTASGKCIGDNEVVSCRFGNNEKTKNVFDLMFLFH